VRLCSEFVELDGSVNAEAGAMESERDTAAAGKQVQHAQWLAPREARALFAEDIIHVSGCPCAAGCSWADTLQETL
jgi:hypothetical protein